MMLEMSAWIMAGLVLAIIYLCIVVAIGEPEGDE